MIISLISKILNLSEKNISAVISLLDSGATIPFIARYRKEATGAMDEVQIAAIADEYTRLQELEKRKSYIIDTITEQGLMTDELKEKILSSWNSTEIEDIYLPFKPKRKTRASVAKELGLEPLAKIIMSGRSTDVHRSASSFVKEGVEDEEVAINGALDIIAEWVNESSSARNSVRTTFERHALISSKATKSALEEVNNESEPNSPAHKYRDYFDKSHSLRNIASHSLLAMRRGENEKVLKVDISVDEEPCIERLNRIFNKHQNDTSTYINRAVKDSFKRLLKPSIETEFAALSKEKADRDAILIFAKNLKQLLLASPLGQRRTLALDPGFRTGCKVVCLDAHGNLLHNDTIYPHPPQNERTQAMKKISTLVQQYDIEAIAIGNGTAGRETEQFIQSIRFDREIKVFSVNESGASIYSASQIARDEFPNYDVTVRGAVSIGRRLMDPLAELVKIDAKSIGVGQYQHDVDQRLLKDSLDRVVESCVNSVGVELNSASAQLLSYVSGIGPKIAQNIVEYRRENGAFADRKSLLKVPKLGAKCFEQCAGFLRISNAKNILDNTAVHPESYKLVEQMAKDNKVSVDELVSNTELRQSICLNNYVTATVGMPTLTDIMQELEKPGRDPRTEIETFEFAPDIKTIDDLVVGMILPCIVNNITNFGAFVDMGIKENGLIHISQITDRYISSPAEVLSIHQHIKAKILTIDKDRKRIQMTMRDCN